MNLSVMLKCFLIHFCTIVLAVDLISKGGETRCKAVVVGVEVCKCWVVFAVRFKDLFRSQCCRIDSFPFLCSFLLDDTMAMFNWDLSLNDLIIEELFCITLPP